ncbi:MAG TPA: hypothetical protein VKQ72_00435, partial [Aggregatilineales bacterium]|nr:hypothetical protein [Aggregatilineales bacterium]
MRRLLRYRYNNIPTDDGGRYFYIYENGDFWSPTYLPVKRELDDYECRHGLGYSVITGKRGGLEAEVLYFVPRGANAEIHQVTLRNQSSETRSVTLFSFVEFCLWNGYDDMTNFQRNFSTGEVEIDGSTIYHKTEYRERRNHFAFYHVNAPLAGFDTDRESFVGLYNGLHEAQAVSHGRSNNSVASGWSPIGSHSLDVTLKPGEEKAFVFILGYVENAQDEKWERPGVINKIHAREMISAFSTTEQVQKALDDL